MLQGWAHVGTRYLQRARRCAGIYDLGLSALSQPFAPYPLVYAFRCNSFLSWRIFLVGIAWDGSGVPWRINLRIQARHSQVEINNLTKLYTSLIYCYYYTWWSPMEILFQFPGNWFQTQRRGPSKKVLSITVVTDGDHRCNRMKKNSARD